MATNRTRDPLRLPLSVAAAYALTVGVVQLVPPVAERVFARTVVDPAVESLAGALLLALGALYAGLAAEPRRSRALVWIVVFGSVLSAANLAYYWVVGAYEAQTALGPIVVDLALAAWIATILVRSRDVYPLMPSAD